VPCCKMKELHDVMQKKALHCKKERGKNKKH